jgi:hypothetical protein
VGALWVLFFLLREAGRADLQANFLLGMPILWVRLWVLLWVRFSIFTHLSPYLKEEGWKSKNRAFPKEKHGFYLPKNGSGAWI